MSAVPRERGTGAPAQARRTGAASLVTNQTRYDLRSFRRNTRARIFTLAVPVLLLLLILVSLFRTGTVKAGGVTVKIAAYYVPHIAAMAIVGAGLPVYFISGIYVPDNVLPHWLLDLANVLPVRPLAVALQAAFVPATNGGQRFALVPILIVAAWGVAGLLSGSTSAFSRIPSTSARNPPRAMLLPQ